MEWNTQHTLIIEIITIIVWNCPFSILCFFFALSVSLFSSHSLLFNLFCGIPMCAPPISQPAAADPNFSKPIQNITIPVGREAVLTCEVHELSSYKVRMNLTIYIYHSTNYFVCKLLLSLTHVYYYKCWCDCLHDVAHRKANSWVYYAYDSYYVDTKLHVNWKYHICLAKTFCQHSVAIVLQQKVQFFFHIWSLQDILLWLMTKISSWNIHISASCQM